MHATIAHLYLDDDIVAARVTQYQDGDVAYYSLGDGPYVSGTILVKPAYFGMTPSSA